MLAGSCSFATTHTNQQHRQQCILLSSGGSFGSRDGAGTSPQLLGSQESSAATVIIKQQQMQLDRLLSRRDSTSVHESVGRAVPAVAVRRSSSGEVQCEPVVLYFGIIDFLQVRLRRARQQWLHVPNLVRCQSLLLVLGEHRWRY